MPRLIRILVVIVLTALSFSGLVAARVSASHRQNAVWLLFERAGDIWGLTTHDHEVMLVKNAHSAAWSWDGKSVAFARGDRIIIAPVSDLRKQKAVCRIRPSSGRDISAVESPVISWEPDDQFLTFSTFQDYALKPSFPTTQDTTQRASTLHLGSIWAVTCNSKSLAEPARWIGPIARGWGNVGAVSVSAPQWNPGNGRLYFIRAGSVYSARISRAYTSGIDDPSGPEQDFDWEADLVIPPMIPDMGGTSEPESDGYGRVSVSRSGALLAAEVTRWNGSGDDWIEVWNRAGAHWRQEQTTIIGLNPSLMSQGNILLYQGWYKSDVHDIFAMSINASRLWLLVRNAEEPTCNPKAYRIPIGGGSAGSLPRVSCRVGIK